MGRDEVLERVARALSCAVSGQAEVLAFVADPGIGKSTLLEAAAGMTAADWHQVRLCGTPAERPIALAAIEPLARALRSHARGLDERQRRAVAGEGADPLALGTALVRLLDLGSRERPLLVLADDLQWFDDASRGALLFAARRLGAERVVLLMASREPAPFEEAGVPVVELRGLTAQEAGVLLSSPGAPIDDGVVVELTRITAGNPLAVTAVAAGLSAPQRDGSAPLPTWVELPARIVTAFGDRVAALSAAAQDVVLLLALGGGESAILTRAMTARGLPADALEAAEASGLVHVTATGAGLVHPLVAQAVVAATAPSEVRRVELVLASAFAGFDDDRAAWHRANATVGTDDEVAAALVRSAERSRRLGASGAAAKALARAAALSGSPQAQLEHLAAAGVAALAAGSTSQAAAYAAEVVARRPDDGVALQVLGQVAALRGRHHEAVSLLVEAARGSRPEVAVRLLVEAAEMGSDVGDAALMSLALGELSALEDHVRADPGVAMRYDIVRAEMLEREGEQATSRALETEVLQAGEEQDAGTLEPAAHLARAVAASHAGDFPRVIDAARIAANGARRRGDVVLLATALVHGRFGQRESGRWSAAYALGEEGLSLVTRDSAPFLRGHLLLGLAQTDARRGAEDACRRRVAEVREINEDLDLIELDVLADRWDATLDLGLGRLEAVVERLERTRRRARGTAADHSYHSPVSDLVEAYVRLGRAPEAAALVPEFARLAPPGSFPPARAALRWTEGMVAGPEDYDAMLTESAAAFGAMGMHYHQARVLLVLGERRRRESTPASAREALHEALRLFDMHEARPWSDRARSELAATGDPRAAAGTSRTPLTEELTAQELQIAMLVAEGRQNREIAGALFLSVRTVEFHLTRVYRKLGVRGRAALAHRLSNAA